MREDIVINDLSDMKTFANRVADVVFPGFVVGLDGALGVGKTTFTQFFGAALGIEDRINSPTFTIIKHYHTGAFPFVHVDAYRLEGVGYDAEVEEATRTNGVCVVEWVKYVEESLPEDFLTIHIEHGGDERRRIRVTGRGRYEDIAHALGT